MNRQKQLLVSVSFLAIMLVTTFFMPLMKANASVKQTAVVVKLTLPGGKWIEARVVENGFLKIHDDKTGQMTAFSMEVIDRKTGTVRVKAIEVTDDKDNPSRELESLEVSFKSPKMTSAIAATNIEVLAIEEQISEKGSEDNLRPGECCVTCDGITACANCRVTMSCGSCNTDRCPN